MMEFSQWLSIVGICMLGAMSPGPSLAVSVQHTLQGGFGMGARVAIAHGLGVGLYAMGCLFGLATLIVASPMAYGLLQWVGAAYLCWLGIKALGLKTLAKKTEQPQPNSRTKSAWADGFLIVFLNPKIAVFFLALFSQVIDSQTPWLGKMLYAMTAMIIDAGWYLIVAFACSTSLKSNTFSDGFQTGMGLWVNRAFGILLITMALSMVLTL